MAFRFSMTEALRLTRSGNLAEATALLKSALGGGDMRTARPERAAGDVIDLVAERVTIEPAQKRPARRAKAAPTAPAKPDAPGTFEKLSYRGNAGSIDYRLYGPVNAAPGMPLVIMLHGCTQSPGDFARGTGMSALADEFGFLVAYPQQDRAANPQKCWNWFRPGDQKRGRGEPALLASLTSHLIAEHACDAERVYVAGLSAGGAAAAIMASEYPDLFAAVGIHSGLACGAAKDVSGAMSAMQRGGGKPARAGGVFIPVITFHGDRDHTVHEVNAQEIVAAATAAAGRPLKVRTERGQSPAGRAYSRSLSADAEGKVLIEQWTIAGSGHAWSGGAQAGSYTDPRGPDASREMLRFFLEHRRA